MTQIGNAFPPSVATMLYEWFKGQLLRRDGLRAERLIVGEGTEGRGE